MSIGVRVRVQAVAFAVLAGLCGCTFTHRVKVPRPVVEPTSNERIVASIGVHYAAGNGQAEEILRIGSFGEATHRWVSSVDEPLRETFDALLPQLFAHVEPSADPGPPAPGSPLDAVIEVRAVQYAFDNEWQASGECRAWVACTFALRARDVGPVASLRLEAERRQGMGFGTRYTTCIGEATSMALQEIGARFARELPEVPGAKEWLARFRREPAPAVAAAPPPLPAAPDPSAGPELEDPSAAPAAPAGPVRPRAPLPPRALGVTFGAGATSARGGAGHLESPRGRVALVAGLPIRVRRHVGFDVDFQTGWTTFSAPSAPPQGFFGPTLGTRLELLQMMLCLGVRAVLPLGALEPSASVGPAFVYQKLSWPATLFGVPGVVDERESFTVGLHASLGLDLLIPPRYSLGVRYRWLFARGDFGPLSAGSADTGGAAVLVQFGIHYPKTPPAAKAPGGSGSAGTEYSYEPEHEPGS